MTRFVTAAVLFFLSSSTVLLVAGYSNIKMACLVNKERANQGLSPLGIEDKLVQAAQVQSDDQAKMGSMTHTGSDGSTGGQRATRQGFDWNRIGENVAYGYSDEVTCMQQWMNSPPHRENILGEYELFGSAVAYAGSTPYYTQVFGKDSGGVRNIPNCDNESYQQPSGGNNYQRNGDSNQNDGNFNQGDDNSGQDDDNSGQGGNNFNQGDDNSGQGDDNSGQGDDSFQPDNGDGDAGASNVTSNSNLNGGAQFNPNYTGGKFGSGGMPNSTPAPAPAPSPNFQQPGNNFQQPSNNFQQPSNNFQQPSNNFQQSPRQNYQRPNNYRQPSRYSRG